MGRELSTIGSRWADQTCTEAAGTRRALQVKLWRRRPTRAQLSRPALPERIARRHGYRHTALSVIPHRVPRAALLSRVAAWFFLWRRRLGAFAIASYELE